MFMVYLTNEILTADDAPQMLLDEIESKDYHYRVVVREEMSLMLGQGLALFFKTKEDCIPFMLAGGSSEIPSGCVMEDKLYHIRD